MDEKKVQQAFVQFLAQKYQLKSQQELEAKIQELGEDGLKAEYAEFQKVIAQQQSRKMMFGAKLNYIKGLKGQCPKGYEMRYYKIGGVVCPKCEAIKNQVAPQDPIDAFRCGRKMKKKACGGTVKEAKCGTKVEMDKCGKKMKKKACGGPVKKDQKGEAIKPVKTVKTVITYPNQLEGQVRRVQYFDDGTQAVLNGGWGIDGMYYQTLRGRQGEFGDIYGTPRQRQIADSLKRVDWKDYGTGPVYVPALKKKSRTK